MEPPPKPQTSLFDVYLRLRPSVSTAEPFIDVEQGVGSEAPKHITIKPPSGDHRKRAVEKFAFTRVFEDDATQLDLFQGAGVQQLVEGVLGSRRQHGRDALLATLGVTGSGKSHTILGSRSLRGLTQMTLDVLFRSIGDNAIAPSTMSAVFPAITASDSSDAQVVSASSFLDGICDDAKSIRGSCSRAQTPMMVGDISQSLSSSQPSATLYPQLDKNMSTRLSPTKLSSSKRLYQTTKSRFSQLKESSLLSIPIPPPKGRVPRSSALPQSPSVEGFEVPVDDSMDYVIVMSMYEVYNDRIFDLLTSAPPGSKPSSQQKRRALLFKSTEMSPDRKVVAGLKKVVCCTLEDALMVLETGLIQRRVAGTGSNAVSSRSHGFFCMEVKRRNRLSRGHWSGTTLTVVDLAGSERARQAKTAGATLAEAGKINESLMYLGQCMQMQSDNNQDGKQSIVPFRQCKLTELLFSNSFPSPHVTTIHHHHHSHYYYSQRNPQKAIMIVTADPAGDFNATSQILRYSALAREVTVPRIPSVTSTILAPGAFTSSTSTAAGSQAPSGRSTPADDCASSNASAGANSAAPALRQEVARLGDEIAVLTLQLEEERARRETVEACWAAAETRISEIEAEVREECFEEMERRVQEEKRRWVGAWDEEADRSDERMDRKIEILERGIGEVKIWEDDKGNKWGEEKVAALERENDELRMKIDMLEREKLMKTPSAVGKKQRVLKARRWEVENEDEMSP